MSMGPLFPKTCRTRGALLVNMLQTVYRKSSPGTSCGTPRLAKKDGNEMSTNDGSTSNTKSEDQKKWKKNAKRILETLCE